MLNKVFNKVFGSRNDRQLKRLNVIVDKINAFESAFEALSDDELRQKTEIGRASCRERGSPPV